VLIGHSMGGVVELLLAGSHADRLTSLIVEDTPIPFVRDQRVGRTPPPPW
jgi:pimeloyl-ACP methyl ester carboxylesterase